MSEALHTPGPWQAIGGYTPKVMAGDTLLCIPSAHADDIGGRSLTELTANAQLIAAAPDLLAASLDAAELIRKGLAVRKKLTGIQGGGASPVLTALEAAIAKATGVS